MSRRMTRSRGVRRRAVWARPGAVLASVAALLALALTPESVLAQAEALGRQQLGRPYFFVFLAYAIGWALILGWVVSIARRLGRVESRLQDGAE